MLHILFVKQVFGSKVISKTLAQRLGCTSKEKASKRKKTLIFLVSLIELIWPGSKLRVKITRIPFESFFSRCMQRLEKDLDKNKDTNKDINKGMNINNAWSLFLIYRTINKLSSKIEVR